MKLLLISSDYERRLRRKHALEDAGHDVTHAGTLPEAWAYSDVHEWELVIVDFDICVQPESIGFGLRYIVMRLEQHATDEYVVREVSRLARRSRTNQIQ